MEVRTPTRAEAFLFFLKATTFRTRRLVRDAFYPVARHKVESQFQGAPSICEIRTALWSAEHAEKQLTLGKIENLRRAIANIDGVFIPAHQTFSFWKQLGRPLRSRGYVEGRELREGCLIPSVGGGLCQLSNALYQLGLGTGCEIVERHAHSRVIPGSAAEHNQDATVFWNYVDLRFRPERDLLLRAKLTQHELVLTAHGDARQAVPSTLQTVQKAAEATNDCGTCGISACFRHSEVAKPASTRQGFLLDECWPEHRAFLEQQGRPGDFVAVCWNGNGRYEWGDLSRFDTYSSLFFTAKRSLRSRALGDYGARRLETQLKDSSELASRFRDALPFDCEHVFVSQSLLPFLWKTRVLHGRTFSVLMTRLPLATLHARLDEALTRHPGRKSLGEFRAPEEMVAAESEALAAAEEIITPHAELKQMFGRRAKQLEWVFPEGKPNDRSSVRGLLFPGPTAARKGCYEVREVAEILGLKVFARGAQLEGHGFWNGTAGAVDGCPSLVVQPALVEDAPRSLLRMLAQGKTVICTEHCGLPLHPNVVLVPYGDARALTEAVRVQLEN